MGEWLFRAIITIIRLASYTLEPLAVLQILYHFDHHNCSKGAVLPFAQPGMKYILLRPQMFCYLFNSCPVPLRNILFIWVWESSFLSVLVLLSFPSWQAVCWLHSPLLGAMLTRLHLFGNFREGILFPSLPLFHWMQAIQNTNMQSYRSVKGRSTQQNCSSGFWIGLGSYLLTY